MTQKIVARITKYCVSEGSDPEPWCSKEQPAWVIGDPAYHDNYKIFNEYTLLAPLLTRELAAEEDLEWERAFGVTDHADDYEIVPPEEWPDEVCAAVAKYMLLGEANNG